MHDCDQHGPGCHMVEFDRRNVSQAGQATIYRVLLECRRGHRKVIKEPFGFRWIGNELVLR